MPGRDLALDIAVHHGLRDAFRSPEFRAEQLKGVRIGQKLVRRGD